MKKFLMILSFGMAFHLFLVPARAEAPGGTQEELFSTRGTVTEVKPEEKLLRVKTEGGLALTFRVDEKTQIQGGEEEKTLGALAVDDPVEMEYVYNENYEKIARTIKKQLKGAPSV